MALIVVTVGLPEGGFELLTDAGHRVVMPSEATRAYTRQELLALLPEADAVVACNTFDAEMIHAAPKLKHIANYGAGYDAIDYREAARLGIPVTNIPETVTESTAELAVGLMLAVCRRIGEMNLRLRQEPTQNLFGLGREMGINLRGLILGIVGAGRIGGRTAQLASAFGMKPIGYSRHGADPSVMEPVSFDELIARSDVVSLHCPLTPETRGLISREVLQRMKPGAILINTSRGPVVDNDALCDMLESGHLSGAGLDVFPEEPMIPERIKAQSRAVITPHVGSNTRQTRLIMAQALARQIMDVLEGRRPDHIVNGL